jgi:hypothetical protein
MEFANPVNVVPYALNLIACGVLGLETGGG